VSYRNSDLEVTARYLNEVEALQHVHLINIPVWFGLLRNSKTDACRIDALCVCYWASNGTNLFGTMMYGGQRSLTAIIQSLWLTPFVHTARMDDIADAKRILLASPLADWRRQPGCLRITWLSNQLDLRHHHPTLPEAADMAHNLPL